MGERRDLAERALGSRTQINHGAFKQRLAHSCYSQPKQLHLLSNKPIPIFKKSTKFKYFVHLNNYTYSSSSKKILHNNWNPLLFFSQDIFSNNLRKLAPILRINYHLYETDNEQHHIAPPLARPASPGALGRSADCGVGEAGGELRRMWERSGRGGQGQGTGTE